MKQKASKLIKNNDTAVDLVGTENKDGVSKPDNSKNPDIPD